MVPMVPGLGIALSGKPEPALLPEAHFVLSTYQPVSLQPIDLGVSPGVPESDSEIFLSHSTGCTPFGVQIGEQI